MIETSLHKLYTYDHIRRLLINDSTIRCFTTDNAPMNKKPIKIHKGLDNHVVFRVFDPDRNPAKVCGFNLFGRIFNTENRELVLEKPCTTNSATGMLFLDLDEGDLADLPQGLYDLVIVKQESLVAGVTGENVTTALYTDFDSNISATLLLSPQAERVPRESHVIGVDDWSPAQILKNGTGPLVRHFYSSAIPGARVHNHTHSTHSFSVNVADCDGSGPFTGTLEVFGTLDENPDPSPSTHGWFPIDIGSEAKGLLTFQDYYGTDMFFFVANIMWLKFVYTPSHEVQAPGVITKVIVRS